jgi:thiol-disulfide isomerase/thioredoxin
MKFLKKLVVFALSLFCMSANAQFNLKGKVVNYSGKEELKINIPLVFGFSKENNIKIPIAKDGSFSILLPIKETKFANLIFQRKFNTLLLSQSKNLIIQLNVADSTLKLIGGTALAENKVMQAVDVESYPFFLKNDGAEFSKLTLEQLKLKVVMPYFAQRDEKIKMVMNSSIALKDKLLISLELKSIAYNYLNDLARTGLTNKKSVDSLVLQIFDNSTVKPSIFPAGPQYFAFIDNYVRYLETKAFIKIKADKIPSNKPIPYFGISLDSANIFIEKYSKPQWRLLGALNNIPLNIVEQYAFQQIIDAYNFKELKQVEQLSAVFRQHFPVSKHTPEINLKLTQLKAILAANELNAEIKIVQDYPQISSIYDVVRQFKGKVVYLDVWGTWCGPCKMEIPYLPKLKKRFKDKDIVYVYLDMDEDKDDLTWKQFIKVNAMAGVHLRKNRQTIDAIWKELLVNATDKAEYYPQYFIFDKEGKLAVTKALRPSSEQALYEQLSVYLK